MPDERFYYDDPSAPAPNVPLKPGAAAIIRDPQNRILILKRTHGPYWSLPGGRQEIGESASECCTRETEEETRLKTEVVRLIGLYTNPSSICSYPDGNVHQSYFALFECRVMDGDLGLSHETLGWHWLSQDEFGELPWLLLPDNEIAMRDAWEARQEAWIR